MPSADPARHEVPEAGESLTHIKSAFDMFRSAIGLVRDVGEMVPEENKEAVSAALVKAERTARLAEAQIAQALGYKHTSAINSK